MSDFDLAVVGSGFGGSLLAMIARQLGKSVVLLERGSHPRIVIGESSTPLANLMFEELTTRYGLTHLTPLAKWGSWLREYPALACGLKRGFSFFHHPSGSRYFVEASPRNEIADTQWYRADFDAFLMDEARRFGVEYLDHVSLVGIEFRGDSVQLSGHTKNAPLRISAKLVVDASGPRGFLHHALELGQREIPGFPHTQALYSHFIGVEPLPVEPDCGYPVNDAAVHHIFDNGWIWVLQFNNGVTSAGAVARNAPDWNGLLQKIPALGRQFRNATPLYDLRRIPHVSFRSAQICGSQWALLPSAAGFVDPLLSTGFPLTLLGIERLAKALECGSFEDYARRTDDDLLASAALIGALYANMNRFELFSYLSLLYFAAVSYAETARRLQKDHLARSYLLREHPEFGPKMRTLLHRAAHIETKAQEDALKRDILDAIEPIDLAGLRKNSGRSWFPVDVADLFASAAKVASSREEIDAMLARAGFFAAEQSPTSVS
jgi:FADH2 O2-dependent halogenase